MQNSEPHLDISAGAAADQFGGQMARIRKRDHMKVLWRQTNSVQTALLVSSTRMIRPEVGAIYLVIGRAVQVEDILRHERYLIHGYI
jgi:hypothetical protein